MDGTGADAGVVYCEMQVRGRANMAHIRQSYKTVIYDRYKTVKTVIRDIYKTDGTSADVGVIYCEMQVRDRANVFALLIIRVRRGMLSGFDCLIFVQDIYDSKTGTGADAGVVYCEMQVRVRVKS